MFEIFSKNFTHTTYFIFLRGASPPTGAAPLDSAYFGIEDPSRNRLALDGTSAVEVPSFQNIKCSETDAKKIL